MALVLATGAMSYWKAGGGGSVQASVASLNAPTEVGASVVLGSATPSIGWTGSTLSTGSPLQGYYVKRIRTDVYPQTVSFGCGSDADHLIVSGIANHFSCTDTSVQDGSYIYSVTAVQYGWTAVSLESNQIVVQADTTAPTTTDNAPAGWQRNAVTVALSAIDPGILDNPPSGTGVANTYYKVDSAPLFGTGTSVNIPAPSDHSNDGSHTITYYSVDNAGNTEQRRTATVKIDTTGPTHSLGLASKTAGVFFDSSAKKLFYKGDTTGNFGFTNNLTDVGGSGAASVTYPSIATSGWTHGTETILNGVPFASTTFGWSANPFLPATYTITGADVAGNTSTVPVTFASDTSPPVSGSITYTGGYVTALSVPVALVSGSDGTGSGIADTGLIMQRASAPLTDGVCGTFSSFTNVVSDPSLSYSDNSVLSNNCYQYRYFVVDKVGNSVVYSSAGTVKVDNSVPILTAVTDTNGSTDGKLETGDTLVLTLTKLWIVPLFQQARRSQRVVAEILMSNSVFPVS